MYMTAKSRMIGTRAKRAPNRESDGGRPEISAVLIDAVGRDVVPGALHHHRVSSAFGEDIFGDVHGREQLDTVAHWDHHLVARKRRLRLLSGQRRDSRKTSECDDEAQKKWYCSLHFFLLDNRSVSDSAN